MFISNKKECKRFVTLIYPNNFSLVYLENVYKKLDFTTYKDYALSYEQNILNFKYDLKKRENASHIRYNKINTFE